MSLEFSGPTMDADVQSTGGCHLGGIDLCNKIFGTNRRIQKSVESSALGALNGGQIQGGLAAVLKLYLQSKNITGKLLNVHVQAGDLIIVTPGPDRPGAVKPQVVPGATFQKKQ